VSTSTTVRTTPAKTIRALEAETPRPVPIPTRRTSSPGFEDKALGQAVNRDMDLVDEQIEYTGEPVETDEGLGRPQQMAVGKDNVEGGGECPDPKTPPRAPAPGAVGK
jgi:hypothetical protein